MGPGDRTEGSTEQHYGQLAVGQNSDAAGEVGLSDPIAQAKRTGYSDEEIASVPEGTIMGCGCANPTAFAELKEGETVLDIGSGAGFDALLAAHRVGFQGKVIGVDVTPEMVERARQNAVKAGCTNVEFLLGEMEDLPVEDESIDVAISNCVINHCRRKVAVFEEVLRCLGPKGRVLISDLVVEGGIPDDVLHGLDDLWREWLVAATGEREYLTAMEDAGLRDVRVVAETPFASAEMDDRLTGKIVSICVTARR